MIFGIYSGIHESMHLQIGTLLFELSVLLTYVEFGRNNILLLVYKHIICLVCYEEKYNFY